MENALLYGITEEQLGRLQRFQNSAARLVTKLGRHKRITPILWHLHWFRVRQRIICNRLLQIYRAVNGLAPAYIEELLPTHVPLRSL